LNLRIFVSRLGTWISEIYDHSPRHEPQVYITT